MKHKLKFCLLLLCAFGIHAQEQINSVLPDGTELYLYGLGIYENLGENIYVGALYLPLLDTGIEAGSEKRMEMRISAASLSARRFTRFWMDAITLNSSREERAALAPQIQAFNEMFQLGLERGDHVQFDYLEDEDETLFLLNGVVIGRMEGSAFHDVLLQSWLGDTPPSLQLKSGLLNELAPAAMQECRELFAGLRFSGERRELVDRHHAGSGDSAAEAAPRLPNVAETDAEREAREQAERERLARLEQERLEQQRQEREREEARLAALQAEEEARRLEEERARLAAEQARLAEEYRSRLSQWLASRVEYPQRALQRGEEGRVEMNIVVGRTGEVLSHEIIASSGNSQLDRATVDMLDRAMPLPAMPEALDGDSFSFVMPVSFFLDD